MIVLDHVSKAFGSHTVLRDLTLEVPDCQNTVVIGYSGAGKSVMLKLIVGLLEADAGRVVVDDQEGIAADLDQRMQDAVDSYVDPWLEADQPVHPAQFVDVVGVGVAGGGRRR